MNEHPFYNELSLVLVNTYAPKNKFQELVCKMLSPLHGMLVETERIDTVFDDIEAIVLQADIERPRRTTAMQFETTTEASDRYGKLCRAAVSAMSSRARELVTRWLRSTSIRCRACSNTSTRAVRSVCSR